MNRFRSHREILGNHYTIIRNSIQLKKPFVIINFVSDVVFKSVLNEIDQLGSIQYIIQKIWNEGKEYPSIFLTNSETHLSTETFRELTVQIMKNHHIDSVIGLYMGHIGVYYRDGKGHIIGDDIYSTLNKEEINGDYYQIGSRYYTFV